MKDPSKDVSFTNESGLTLELADVLAEAGQYIGQLEYPGYTGEVVWVPHYEQVKKVYVNEDGKVEILGPGFLEVSVCDKKDWSGTAYDKELTRFKITVEDTTPDQIRILFEGKYVQGDSGNYTVAGSGNVTIKPQLLVNGVWKDAPFNLFSLQTSGNCTGAANVFSAISPGKITVTASYKGLSASESITSTHVPVSSIVPAPQGKYVIHGRNANSDGLGDFLDLTLDHGAGNIVMEPENASYKTDWTLTSSDTSIAEYVSSMIAAVLPRKAGTVTLTASVTDPVQGNTIEGTSTITLEYLNPLAEVTGPTETLNVKENQTIDLPLTFTGPRSAEGYHVTEPDMVWTYAGDGAVEITRETPGLLVREEGTDGNGEYCVANPYFKLTGAGAGTVTVTGTPVDQTLQAKPITFTVMVEAGEAEKPVDTPALAADALKNAQNQLQTVNTDKTYAYGDEWDVFALTRSSSTIDPVKVENYLNSVKKAYENPTPADMKPTTIARVVLAVTVLGKDASNLDGLNLIEKLYNNDTIASGGNEPMWALIALDCRGYAVPETGKWSRDKLVSELITKYQNIENGGFGLTDKITTSVDMTAMAVQALAPYYETRTDVKESVDKAMVYLQKEMDRNCRFGTSESSAQVIVALGAMGKDPVDPQNGFVKSVARNPITGLTGFQMADGSFKHLIGDKMGQKMSTIQAICALESYRRAAASENGLYDLTDINVRAVLASRIAEAEGLKQADYTAESWNAMQTALTAAKAALEQTNPESTEEELKTADRALSAAIAALKKVSSPLPDPNKPQGTITVSFRLVGDNKHGDGIDGHTKYVNWIQTCDVVVPKGATVFDAFQIALKNHGMDYKEGQWSYISAIKAPSVLGGYWLSEFDNGPNSGWKYLVNGEYPGVGLRYYWLKNGDNIVWRYVDDYTDHEDNTSKWEEAEDVKVTPSNGNHKPDSGSVLIPEVEADKKGQVKVDLDKKAMESAIAKAKKDKTKEIIIEPDVTGKLNALTVNLPTQSVTEMGKETNAALVIQSKLGVVAIPSEAVRSISDQAKKNTISIQIGKKSVEDVKEKLGEETPKNAEILEVTVLSGDQPISTFGGHELTIQLPANAKLHKEGETYQVIVISGDGTISHISGLCEKVGRKLMVTVKTSHLSTFILTDAHPEAPKPSISFVDVPENHWAREAIQFVYDGGLMTGTGENTFSPESTTSRGMIVTILYRMEGSPAVSGSLPFTDVEPTMYCGDAIRWAVEQKIMNGYGDGRFGPDDQITREQMAVILYHYAAFKGWDVSAKADLGKFVDGASVSSWAKDALSWANAQKLVNGVGDDMLAPQGSASRAQAATILMRYIQTIVK